MLILDVVVREYEALEALLATGWILQDTTHTGSSFSHLLRLTLRDVNLGASRVIILPDNLTLTVELQKFKLKEGSTSTVNAFQDYSYTKSIKQNRIISSLASLFFIRPILKVSEIEHGVFALSGATDSSLANYVEANQSKLSFYYPSENEFVLDAANTLMLFPSAEAAKSGWDILAGTCRF